MKAIPFLLSLFFPLAVFSQNTGEYTDIVDLSDILDGSRHLTRNLRGEAYGTKGSPNVFSDFLKGDIYFSNRTVARNAMINYDCYNDRVLIRRGENEYLLDNRKIDRLVFNTGQDTTALFRQVFLEDKKKTVFMRLLYQNKSSLYKHHYKTFLEADYTGPYSADRRYDEYSDEHAWYIEPAGREPRKLRPKKKALIQIMESHGREIEEFIKREKPDLKSDRDLIRLVEYYDSLE
jgi:hypothetical protein